MRNVFQCVFSLVLLPFCSGERVVKSDVVYYMDQRLAKYLRSQEEVSDRVPGSLLSAMLPTLLGYEQYTEYVHGFVAGMGIPCEAAGMFMLTGNILFLSLLIYTPQQQHAPIDFEVTCGNDVRVPILNSLPLDVSVPESIRGYRVYEAVYLRNCLWRSYAIADIRISQDNCTDGGADIFSQMSVWARVVKWRIPE